MKMIEMHIIQSFPVTCLNRDDLGAPKSAVFGGVSRARVSSQCWKRAIRELAASGRPSSMRGHFIADKLAEKLIKIGINEAQAKLAAEIVIHFVGGTNKKSKDKTAVALFLSEGELDAVAAAIKILLDKGEKIEPKKGELAKIIKKAGVKDVADIAIFGRMVADDHTLTLEGAGLFSHALSTHAVVSELDFFSAVDDTRQDADDAGSGHIGTQEFNSACYYRYVGLNLGLLEDANHLGHFETEERTAVKAAFLRAAIMAVPNARKNSMFGFNPPSYILGVCREGQPLSLINAFERPILATSDGYKEPSAAALMKKWAELKELYCLKTEAEVELPPVNIDSFVTKLLG